MNLAENLKRFFKAKETGKTDAKAPQGVCPNCWGRQEWEGEYYKIIKARNITPESNTYNNFINDDDMLKDVNAEGFTIFLISSKNFTKLFKSGDIEGYDAFFQETYL